MYGVHDNHICDENGNLPQYIKDKISVKAKERIKIPREKDRLQSYNLKKMKKVCQYDLNGKFVKIYSSCTEASKETKISLSQINRCCLGKQKTSHSYMFKYSETTENIEKYVKQKYKNNNICKKINKYTLDGKYIQTYESIIEACLKNNMNIHNSSQISIICNNEYGICNNFQWRYYNKEVEYSNISKFTYKKRKGHNSLIVVMDEKTFESISVLGRYLNKSTGNLTTYLNGKKPMPQKYIDRGLRYYNPETDSHLPIYVDTKNEV